MTEFVNPADNFGIYQKKLRYASVYVTKARAKLRYLHANFKIFKKKRTRKTTTAYNVCIISLHGTERKKCTQFSANKNIK